MLFGRLPSEGLRRLSGAYGGVASGPGLGQQFLNRFGPYRLQPYSIPSIDPSLFSAPSWFQPRGLPEEPMGLWRLLGRSDGGNGRDGFGGARSVDRGAGPKSGGKSTGPGGPRGGRSGPVSR